MTEIQLSNLVNFTILFHEGSGDSKFLNSDPTYIMEKYNSMVGVKPHFNLLNKIGAKEYNLNDYNNKNALKLRYNWGVKWNNPMVIRPRKDVNDIELVARYLSITNSSNLFEIGISGIIALFEKEIGPVNSIKKDLYTHLHPALKRHILKFIEKNKRDWNLNLILHADLVN